MKAAAGCILSEIIDIPTVREWALGGRGCYILEIVQIRCRLFADWLKVVSFL